MKARPIAFALLFAFAPAAVSVSIPRAAYAQTDDALTKAARARFQEGVDAYDKGNFEAARAAFKQAYALRQHPAVLLNLAQSSLKSGHYLEASKMFQQYLNDPQGDKKSDAQHGLADARSKLGRLDVTAPPGSEVTVDSDVVGKTPFGEPIDVEAGNHTVHTRLPDGTSSEQHIVVTAGQVQPVRFGATATMVTPTNPNPPVTNPENPPANPPNNPPNNPPENPPTTPPTQPTQPSERVHPTAALGVAIGGGVLAVGGFILAGVFAGLKSTAQGNLTSVENEIDAAAQQDGLSTKGLCNNPPSKYQNACATLKSNTDAVNQDATVANVGVAIGIVGLAAAAGGLVWFLVGVKKDSSQSAYAPRVMPWAGPGTGGMTFSASF